MKKNTLAFVARLVLPLCLATWAYAQGDDPTQAAKRLQYELAARRAETEALAKLHGIALRQTMPDGSTVVLDRFERGMPIFNKTLNANAAITTRTNRVHPFGGAGFSLTGSGLVLGIWDGGIPLTGHREFGGRMAPQESSATDWHATHVAGTMIAGGAMPSAKGMAPQAQLRAWDFTNDTAEMLVAGPTLPISNHSYGHIAGWFWNTGAGAWMWFGIPGQSEDYRFGYYDTTAKDFDVIAAANPNYTIFKSAGNDRGEGPASQPIGHYEWNGSAWAPTTATRTIDGGATGYDTIPTTSTAKNIVTVGAVNDVASYTGPASVLMASFSGWGPTDDGRIKPDIVANGLTLTSSHSNSSTSYAVSSGTSMACPNASGSAALITQRWAQYFPGGKVPSYFLRGLLIYTADEAGASPGPDYRFGWGLMNTEAACKYWSSQYPTRLYPALVDTLWNGGTKTFPGPRYGNKPIKVTTCWLDAPGNLATAGIVDPPNKMLVRDLDLRVINPSSQTVMPWVLDPANPWLAATTGDNSRDNVEQVFISNPTAGDYTIRITHKGSIPSYPVGQKFALFIDGLEIHNPAP